jgi:hypothetical protein
LETWGAGVGAGDAEIGEERRDRFGRHRGAPIGVDGQLVGADALRRYGPRDERLGQFGGLGGSDHPSDDVAEKMSMMT